MMPGNSSRVIGHWGEDIALEYLAQKGYTAVSRGFRSRFGEIDLIVKNDEFLVFAEVKTRESAGFALPREFVGRAKQRKLIATARYWLAKHPTELQPRFDVIEVYAKQGTDTAAPEIVHIENAFGA